MNTTRFGRDLRSTRAMMTKAGLFLFTWALVGAILVIDRQASPLFLFVLYTLGAWSLARAYYFAFYVIERYCDPTYRYAGVWSAASWIWKHRSSRASRSAST